MKKETLKLDYGNWMPRKFCYIGAFLSLTFIILTIFISLIWIRIITGVLAGFCVIMLFFALRAFYYFSTKGKNLQQKVYDLVIDNLHWDGNGICLDVGCGNAPLSIQIAKKFPQAKIIASDYWGKTPFEYDEKQSKINAKFENVLDQIEFKNINAAHLPFEDESIDSIVSNLVYHEVHDFKMKEKHKGLLEAFRVLRKGGVFVIQDVFGSEAIYGDFQGLKQILEGNVSELNWIDTFIALNLPKWMDNPIMLGGLGIFYGIK